MRIEELIGINEDISLLSENAFYFQPNGYPDYTRKGFTYYYVPEIKKFYAFNDDIKFTVKGRNNCEKVIDKYTSGESGLIECSDDLSSRTNLFFYDPKEEVSELSLYIDPFGKETPIESLDTELESLSTSSSCVVKDCGPYADGRTRPVLFSDEQEYGNYKFLYYIDDDTNNPRWVVSKTTGTVRDQLTGNLHDTEEDIKLRNVYGINMFVHQNTLKKYWMIWLEDLGTYVSLLDENISTPVKIDGDRYYQEEGVLAGLGDYFFRCEKPDIYTRTPVTMHDGTIISMAYYEGNCFTCDVCGKVFHSSEHGRGNVCIQCYVPSFEEVVKNYTFDPAKEIGVINSKGDCIPLDKIHKKARYFGVELEVLVSDKKKATNILLELRKKKLAVGCQDASLSGTGCELKTPPVHYRQIEDHIKKIVGVIDDISGGPDNRVMNADGSCGVHIHVSRSSLTEAQVGRLFTFLHHHLNTSFLECIAGRSSGASYSKFNMSKKEAVTLSKKYKEVRGKKIPNHKHINHERRQALNTEKGVTVEFRMFQGAVDDKIVLRYIEFVRAALSYTAPGSGNRNMYYGEFIRSLSPKEFPVLYSFLEEKGYVKPSKKKAVA